jgi:hypothetical protein
VHVATGQGDHHDHSAPLATQIQPGLTDVGGCVRANLYVSSPIGGSSLILGQRPPRSLETPRQRCMLFLLFWVAMRLARVAGDFTVCPTNQTDWYFAQVGETPCTTYQRLRQICDDRCAYRPPRPERSRADSRPCADIACVYIDQVGNFSATAPGDTCNSEVNTCCCNSIAWALSMLCLK